MRPLGTGTRRLIGGLVNQEPYWSKTQLGRPQESLGSASLLQQLHWLSVPERVTFKLCVMVYRCLHGIGPEYLSEDFRLVSEIYSRQRLRSASSTDVVVPATRRSSLGDRTFPVAGARAWNALPASVTSAKSLSSFRRLLKTFIFQRQRRQ